MPSLRKRPAARAAAAVAIAIAPAAACARLLNAEGPFAVFFAVCIASAASAAAASFAASDRARIRKAAGVLSAALALALAVLVFVQLNVARRSLAEAWLAEARAGRAFGYFSLFASQLYGVLCLAAALLIAAGKAVPGFLGFAAATALAYGTISGNGWASLAALAFGVAAAAFAQDLRGLRRTDRAKSALPVFVLAAAASFPFAFLRGGSHDLPFLPRADLSPLIARAAPSFPLLADVPGYGAASGAARIPAAAELSSSVVFTVRGDPSSTAYLASETYGRWTGEGWEIDPDPGVPVPVAAGHVPDRPPEGALALRVAGDFYGLMPLPRAAARVVAAYGAPEAEASSHRGLRFASSARRGTAALVLPAGDGDSPGETATFPADVYLDRGPEPSSAVDGIARGLARKDAADTLDSILRFLRDGFRYSLSNPRSLEGRGGIERFLEEEKSGYCLHYATAFVLLARSAGIPARVVEGFRCALDGEGEGEIRGTDFHAWAEAWVDGSWLAFEPTPPFAGTDPFAFVDGRDGRSRRHLEAVFGIRSASGSAGKAVEEKNPAGCRGPGGAPAAAFVALAVLFIAAAAVGAFAAARSGRVAPRAERIADRALRSRARSLVRRYRALGVAGPEVGGWTGWASAAAAAAQGGPDSAARIEAVRATAEAMLRAAFDA